MAASFEDDSSLQRALRGQKEFDVSLELVDLGFAYDAKRKSLEHLTPEQRLERKRELARLRKEAQRERDRQNRFGFVVLKNSDAQKPRS